MGGTCSCDRKEGVNQKREESGGSLPSPPCPLQHPSNETSKTAYPAFFPRRREIMRKKKLVWCGKSVRASLPANGRRSSLAASTHFSRHGIFLPIYSASRACSVSHPPGRYIHATVLVVGGKIVKCLLPRLKHTSPHLHVLANPVELLSPHAPQTQSQIRHDRGAAPRSKYRVLVQPAWPTQGNPCPTGTGNTTACGPQLQIARHRREPSAHYPTNRTASSWSIRLLLAVAVWQGRDGP